jgi:hypothetical protein
MLRIGIAAYNLHVAAAHFAESVPLRTDERRNRVAPCKLPVAKLHVPF